MMAFLVSQSDEHHKVAKEMLGVFGLGGKEVASFEFKMGVNRIVSVKAEVYVEFKQMKELVAILKRYKVVPLDPEPPEDAA